MDERKLFKKSDLLVMLGVVAVAAACLLIARLSAPPGAVCRVLYDGGEVKTVSLAENGVFRVAEAPLMEFEVRDGRIAAVHSDCPDKVCVRTGFIGASGQKIVCLPNRIVVSLDADKTGGNDPDEPDMIAQ